MNLSLNIFKIEIIIYFLVWTLAVLYAIYCFATDSYKYFQNYQDYYEDFVSGWHFLSNKRDRADFEWETIFYLLYNFYTWICLYLFVAEIIRYYQPANIKIFQLWQILFTLYFIQFKFGFICVCIILYQPAIFYFTKTIVKGVLFIYICTGISLYSITYYKQVSGTKDFRKFSTLNDHELYITTLSLFWLNLKCLSYYLEKQDGTGILDLLSYCLHPPTMFSGPFISYTDYHNIYKTSQYLPIEERLTRLITNFIRSIFWFLFGNFCLHYIYVNATSFQPKLVQTFNSWSLYGYGYTMGQYFHIKYIIIYGLSTSCASYENVNVPHLPRCIGRVHLYSDMWKYFDPGLYKFLVRQIYVPVMNISKSKLTGSFMCFLFVYIWHGIENYILIWTILNYLGVTLEYLCSSLQRKYLNNGDVKFLSPYWFRRIKCFFAAPLLAVSAVSNFYFFAGTEIGNIFFQRLFMDKFITNAILILILYSCCQISMELRNVSANRM